MWDRPTTLRDDHPPLETPPAWNLRPFESASPDASPCLRRAAPTVLTDAKVSTIPSSDRLSRLAGRSCRHRGGAESEHTARRSKGRWEMTKMRSASSAGRLTKGILLRSALNAGAVAALATTLVGSR